MAGLSWKMLGIAPCPVAGLSMGGYVAQALAVAYPGIASRVILVDTKAEADAPAAKPKRDAMAALALEHGARAVTERMLPDMTAPGADARVGVELRSIMDTQSPRTLAAACVAMRDRADFAGVWSTVESPIDWIFGRPGRDLAGVGGPGEHRRRVGPQQPDADRQRRPHGPGRTAAGRRRRDRQITRLALCG